jgi:predicted RNA-binding protein associated with RNAse of E/G family
MKARRLVASGSYGPDQLKALGKAFDDAWARIAPTVSSRAKAMEATRLKLADIILGLAKQGNFDPQWLADTAVQLVLTRSSRSQP